MAGFDDSEGIWGFITGGSSGSDDSFDWDSYWGWDSSDPGSSDASSSDASSYDFDVYETGGTGGWQTYSNGVAISPDGKYYQRDPAGNLSLVYDPTKDGSAAGTGGSGAGSSAWNKIASSALKGVGGGSDSGGGLAAAGILGGLYGLYNSLTSDGEQQRQGYQGGIPSYTAVRQQVPIDYSDPNYRPGQGRNYFTDTQYVTSSDTAGLAQAQANAATQAQQMQQQNATNAAGITGLDQRMHQQQAPTQPFASGGQARVPNYLGGNSDGMADKIHANIDGKQEARLSHGEFVVPADVVSHLGNGNSTSGAQRLYDMMARVRQARTGSPSQGRQINPNKFLPR